MGVGTWCVARPMFAIGKLLTLASNVERTPASSGPQPDLVQIHSLG